MAVSAGWCSAGVVATHHLNAGHQPDLRPQLKRTANIRMTVCGRTLLLVISPQSAVGAGLQERNNIDRTTSSDA